MDYATPDSSLCMWSIIVSYYQRERIQLTMTPSSATTARICLSRSVLISPLLVTVYVVAHLVVTHRVGTGDLALGDATKQTEPLATTRANR